MAESSRIEELKRRVERDPASIAFAMLAEEYRREGAFADAVRVCRDGLSRHSGYLAARVTLGRALIELGEYAEAREELERVVRDAPDNLAAIRALAELHQRRDERSEDASVVSDALVLPDPPELPEPDELFEPRLIDPAVPLDLGLAPGHDEERFSRALEALDSMDLDDPPAPAPTVTFEPADDEPEAFALSDAMASLDVEFMPPPPHAESTSLDALELMPPVSASPRSSTESAAIADLERWLEAIALDRAARRLDAEDR